MPENQINRISAAIASDNYLHILKKMTPEQRTRAEKQWSLVKNGLSAQDVQRFDAAISLLRSPRAVHNILTLITPTLNTLKPATIAQKIRDISQSIANNALPANKNTENIITDDERHLVHTFLQVSSDCAQWFEHANINHPEKMLQVLTILCDAVRKNKIHSFADIQKMNLEQGVQLFTEFSKILKRSLLVYDIHSNAFFTSIHASGNVIDSHNRTLHIQFSAFKKKHALRLPLIYQGTGWVLEGRKHTDDAFGDFTP